jgi:hypothetical protein
MPTDTDEAMEAVKVAIARIRALNRARPSRAKALALTRCEEALHWLWGDSVAPPNVREEKAR